MKKLILVTVFVFVTNLLVGCNPSKVTDPTNVHFDVKKLDLYDYRTEEAFYHAMVSLFPLGTKQEDLESVLSGITKCEFSEGKVEKKMILNITEKDAICLKKLHLGKAGGQSWLSMILRPQKLLICECPYQMNKKCPIGIPITTSMFLIPKFHFLINDKVLKASNLPSSMTISRRRGWCIVSVEG